MNQTTLTTRTFPLPTWLPDDVRASLAGRDVSVRIPAAIKSRMRTPERLKISEWANRYRKVTEIDAFPGPWRNELVPHTAKIMDVIGLANVREVWLCMVERSAKTQIITNAAMWSLDQKRRSGNIFWLMPTEKDARDAVGERIIPCLRACSRTKRLLSDKADDTSRGMIRFKHGVRLRPAWSNSPASMASYFGRLNIADEIDKFAERTSEGSDPITLFKKRSREDRAGSKYIFASSPGNRFIHKGMKACQQLWEYHVRCPDCGKYHLMGDDNLFVHDDANLDNISLFDVYYVCAKCSVHWGEKSRKAAYLAGRWECTKGKDIPRPETVGFHFPALPCPSVSLNEIMTAKMKAATGSVIDKVAYANGYKAIDYEDEIKDRDEDFILRLVNESMPRGICPRDPCSIIVLADTQQIGVHYEVWAFGWGRDLDVKMIDHGYLLRFDHLAQLSTKEWRDPAGKKYRAQAGFIDSGGGTNPFNKKHSRTAEVYEFCRRHRFFRPFKGRRDQAQPWTTTKIDYFPGAKGKKIAIPGGLILYLINVTMYKDSLAGKLQVQKGDPGSLELHAETGLDYAKQMCAEYKDEHGWWHCPRHKDNHHWDIGVYGLAAADILQIRSRKKGTEGNIGRRVLSPGLKR